MATAAATSKRSEDADVERPALTVPDHELLRCIGRGSYGEVWLARGVLGLLRAVKIVYRKRFADARPYEREFTGILRVEPLSRASEGLVDILHVGRHEPEGYFYYVMELADDAAEEVPGALASSDAVGDARWQGRPAKAGTPCDAEHYQPRTLSRDLKRRGKLRFEECVRLGLNVSSALSHLHQHGLVHRDVKPSNILYVEGAPKLGDVGLVGESGESGSYVGTDGYIPPEGPNSPRADVFGLGKVLYEVSTGRDRLEFPVLPMANAKEERQQLAELNEIVLKACAPDPRRRYESAEELHADLALLHRGQSVRRKRREQKRWRATAVAACMAAFACGIVGGALWSPRARPTGTGIRTTSPVTPQAAVDLTSHYNVALGSNWLHDFEGNNLAALPTDWRRFGPAYFRAEGIIQLSGGYLEGRRLNYPGAIEGIPINRKCIRLHFLHGVVWLAPHSAPVATYVLHYADGSRAEIPVRYGEEVKNWWFGHNETLNVPHASVAWVGTNAVAGGSDKLARLRLYALTWNNPFPEQTVTSLDFVSVRSMASPFLLAVTAESE